MTQRRKLGRPARRRRIALLCAALAAVFAAGTLVGCSSDENQPRVSPAVQADLPTTMYALYGELCPEGVGLNGREAQATRARGRRQLAALLKAYRSDPEALVRVSYITEGKSGYQHELITVEELLDSHLEGIATGQEVADPGTSEGRCLARGAAALRGVRE